MPRPATDRNILLNFLRSQYGGSLPSTITRKELYGFINAKLITEGECRWIWNDPTCETSTRGVYAVPNGEPLAATTKPTVAKATPAAAVPVLSNTKVIAKPVENVNLHLAVHNGAGSDSHSFVPRINPNFVPFGIYDDLKQVLKSRVFCPVWITGLSGNGKTETVKQICAELGREYFRVNITVETDEMDLLGSLHLENGNTVFRYGPVVEAMRRGAVLLLDELDCASYKIMCLQPILEGNPVFLKKTGELIYPEPGFTIVATANTKGQGDMSGKFLGTSNMNEATLERFPITLEQKYPSVAEEKKILTAVLRSVTNNAPMTPDDKRFIDSLTAWSAQIRDSYNNNACTEVITTRRLIWAIQTYHLFNRDRVKAVQFACNRFDRIIVESFVKLFAGFDAVSSSKEQPIATATPIPAAA